MRSLIQPWICARWSAPERKRRKIDLVKSQDETVFLVWYCASDYFLKDLKYIKQERFLFFFEIKKQERFLCAHLCICDLCAEKKRTNTKGFFFCFKEGSPLFYHDLDQVFLLGRLNCSSKKDIAHPFAHGVLLFLPPDLLNCRSQKDKWERDHWLGLGLARDLDLPQGKN